MREWSERAGSMRARAGLVDCATSTQRDNKEWSVGKRREMGLECGDAQKSTYARSLVNENGACMLGYIETELWKESNFAFWKEAANAVLQQLSRGRALLWSTMDIQRSGILGAKCAQQ